MPAMHELALCQGMLTEVERIAAQHGATGIERIVLRIGPLAGVEPRLLYDAFPIASAGTIAEDAELEIEPTPLRVRCERCNEETDVLPNRLLCGACGDFHTRVISGDELLLASVELIVGDEHV